MDRAIIRSIMRCTTLFGREYEVVEFNDGGWGIARDGKPMPDMYWPASEMDQCIKAHGQLCIIECCDPNTGNGKCP